MRTTHNADAPHSFDRLTFAKISIGIVSLLLAYYGFWRIRDEFLRWVNNTDILFLAALYRDLTMHAYSLRGWTLTPAPYFLPDMPFFFFASAVTRSLPSAYTLYAAINATCILACLYWIARRITPSRADRLMVVGLVSLVMFLACRPATSHCRMLMGWLLAPTGHGGGMLWGMVLLELGLRLQEQITPGRIIAFVVAVFAAVFSDRLVVTQFLAPLAATAFVLLLVRRRWTLLFGLALISGLSAVAAYSAGQYILFTQKHTSYSIILSLPQVGTRAQLAQCWPIFCANWKQVAGPSSALFALMVAGFIAALTVSIVEFRQRRPAKISGQTFGTATILIFVLFSWASAVAVPVLTCIWDQEACFRYALGLMVWAALLLTLAGVWAARQASSQRGVLVGAIALGLGLLCWLPVLAEKKVHASRIFYSPDVRFIDAVVTKYRLHNGYAGYWQSRPITLSSKTGVMLCVVDDPWQPPRFWIDNPNHWCQVPGGPTLAYPIYDFVICPSVDEKKMIERFGPPAFVEAGKALKFKILIYNRPSDVAFRNLGRAAALDAAHLALPRRIIRPESLNHMKEEGCDWMTKGARIIPSGQQLVLNVVPPLGGDLLQIMTHARYGYHVEFKLGTQSVGDFQLPAKTLDGMRLQDVVLAPITHGKPFDTIVISPPDGPGDYSVGAVIVLPDSELNIETKTQQGVTFVCGDQAACFDSQYASHIPLY